MNEYHDIAKVPRFSGRRSAASDVERVRKTLVRAFSAFTTGARLIPMGDNGGLLKSLAAKSIDR